MRISDWSSDVCSSDLARLQPAQPALRSGNAVVGQQLQVDPLLLLQLAVERLPRVLEFVEFHGRFHRHSLPGAATWSRIRCLRRLILVVTLLSEMPSTSAISRVLDRNSVVSGKSVSVRVDLGGRGILKKK